MLFLYEIAIKKKKANIFKKVFFIKIILILLQPLLEIKAVLL